MLDLDHFKPINDTFGHSVGDALLEALKDRLQGCLRSDVVVGRLGGDEFLLILRNHTAQQLDVITERLLHELRRPFPVGDRWLRIDGSIGRATVPSGSAADVASLLRKVDSQMYAVKVAKREERLDLDAELLRQETSTHTPKASGGLPSRELVSLARAVLGMDLAFLSRIDGEQQTFVVVDAPSRSIHLSAGTSIAANDGFCTLLLGEAIPPVVADLATEPMLAAMPVTAELGIGAYCGVPVRLPDGSLYGTLCGLHPEAFAGVGEEQLTALRVVADLLGHSLERERRVADQRRKRRDAFSRLIDGPGRRLVVQPIVDLSEGRRRGFEALSRFTSDAGLPLAPDRVFAEARELGLLTTLEQACARTALEQLSALPADVYLSINFSPDSLLDPDTRRLLATGDLDRVVIEITEHEQVADYAAVRDVLTPLRSNGLRLAVDDTGAGFASLQHLTELAPDVVKLDVAFVRHIDTDPARRAVARAVTSYATEVGATVVAEGIETPEQAATLRRLGVHCGQGWFYGRPQSWPDLQAAAETSAAITAR